MSAWPPVRFSNRSEAGIELAKRLQNRVEDHAIVLGLPRGGVPVAFEVARAMRASLDVMIVRKIGLPQRPELAMGAIGENGLCIVNKAITEAAGIDKAQFARAKQQGRIELARRIDRLRANHPRQSLVGRAVIVVDDGIATGSTMRVACQMTRASGAARVILAVPVATPSALAGLSDLTDEVICLQSSEALQSVGHCYADFSQISDNHVLNLLNRAEGFESNIVTTETTGGNEKLS